MRLLLKLRSLKNCSYDLQYFHKLQGFIYSTIRPLYPQLHELQGYKFFCFSNLFPLKEKNGVIPSIRKGETRNLLISSPDKIFIKAFVEGLKEVIYIGEMNFEVEDVKLIKIKLTSPLNLISATPIIIRIPERNYEHYNIPQHYRKPRYVFWRRIFPFDVFVRQLEENLFKKYSEFHKLKTDEFPLFEQFILKKAPVVCHTPINGKNIELVGSLWEFSFHHLSDKQKRILEFGVECGFGERNSLGFGFMNILRDRSLG